MLPKILMDLLLGGKCGCPSCSRKAVTRKVQLTGDALAAAIEGNEAFEAHAAKLKQQLAELEASKRRMWSVIQQATGTEDIDGLSLDLDHADLGFVVLEVPVKGEGEKPDDTNTAADGNQDDGDLEEAFRNAPDPVPVVSVAA